MRDLRARFIRAHVLLCMPTRRASVESLCGVGAFASKVCDNDAVSKKVKIVEKALALHSSKDSRFTCKEARASAMLSYRAFK